MQFTSTWCTFFRQNRQLLFLIQRKRENGPKNYFMAKSPRKNLSDVGIELGAPCMPSGHLPIELPRPASFLVSDCRFGISAANYPDPDPSTCNAFGQRFWVPYLRTSLLPNSWMDRIRIWSDDSYVSKDFLSTIPPPPMAWRSRSRTWKFIVEVYSC